MVDSETYKYINFIGEGMYGKVYLVKGTKTKKYFAMKTIDVNNLKENQRKECYFESKILQKLDHPNIIKLKEVFIARKPIYTLNIVTEYADDGDLNDKIIEQKDHNSHFLENQIIDWFTQICFALYHIQKKEIIHRDLKPQNVFLTKSSMIKLGDFGISKNINTTWEKTLTLIGTPYYIAPEVFEDQTYSFKSDIWSLGIILYQLMDLIYPFQGNSLPTLMINIMKGEFNKIKNNFYSEDLKYLCYSLLNVNPELRPSIIDLLNCDVVKKRTNILLKEVNYDKDLSIKIIKNLKQSIFSHSDITPGNDDIDIMLPKKENIINNDNNKINIENEVKKAKTDDIKDEHLCDNKEEGKIKKKATKEEIKNFFKKKGKSSGNKESENNDKKEKKDIVKIKFDNLKNYLTFVEKEVNIDKENNNNNNNNLKQKVEYYNVNRFMNLLSSYYNGEEEKENISNINIEKEKEKENLNELRENNNISEKEAQLGTNLQLYKLIFLSSNDIQELKEKKKKLEKIYGKEIFEKLKKCVSENTDKTNLKYNIKGIKEVILESIKTKDIKIEENKFNEILKIIPDIFSFVIADKIRENNK